MIVRQIVSLGTEAFGWRVLRGGLSKGYQPVFMRVSEKTTGNSERLDRQARPGIEPGTSRLPVYSAAIGGGKDGQFDVHALPGIRTQDLLVQQPASLTTTLLDRLKNVEFDALL